MGPIGAPAAASGRCRSGRAASGADPEGDGALSGNLQLVPIDAARLALEADFRAMTDSGMLRGEIPSFADLLERISQLEARCNAIARSLA